jgi:hypothetical protein
MTSQYKYDNILGDKEKNLISILLNKGKSIEYLSNRFGISKKFIRTNLCNPDRVYSICLGSKKTTYYNNEMQYGKLELNYSFDELNNNEIEAYNNYELKTKAHYET